MAKSEQRDRTRSGSLLESVSIGGGLAAGVIAYVLGYGVIAISKSDAIDSASGVFGILSQFAGQIDYPTGWKLAGWVFYRAHNVDILFESSGTESSNPIAFTETVFWEPWFFAVPVIALALAGAVVAYATAARSTTAGAVAGGSVVLGYIPVVAVGAVVTGWSTASDGSFMSFEASAGPDLLPALLVAGFIYPLVVGGIGGSIAGAIRGR
ncbi:putative membrane protein [Halorhabdus sp. SVX81]|uniref:hypothetical protein n=1 Tax=Halorhabdus sp. SVX81 TaxID=2978283 RepID=UPI0023D9E5EB|nr:hypothetical protein [Halorhabdus sp. SVX81]WEL18065.1 putative membrane protein [Halorhabdus sp. SVX81]